MAKHAYLIIAHNESQILKTLLRLLDDERNDIFLHIDARAVGLYRLFQSFSLCKAHLFVLEERMSVYWGDLSMVKAEYLLMETALAQGRPYSYYHLLSGVDLPLKSQTYIHQDCEKHAGKEFVSFWDSPYHRKDTERRVYRHYLFTRYLKGGSPVVHGLTAFIRNVVLAMQKVTKYRRRQPTGFKKGSQWVSITHDFCVYLVGRKQAVLHTFRRTLCPDEHFIQTELWNSPFRTRIFDGDDAQKGSMRAIDWERGNPYTWQEADVDELLASPCWFARKFSSEHAGIVEAVYHQLKP